MGGHAVQCHETSSFQVNEGHKVTVITCKRRKTKSLIERVNPGYFVIRLKRVWMPWDSAGMFNPLLPALWQTIRYIDYDIMHAHSHLFLLTLGAIISAKRKGKPIVTTIHGTMEKRNFFINLCQYVYLYTLGSWIFKNSTRIICLTKADAREISRFGADCRKIRVLSNAVNPTLFAPGGVENGKLILWVGRFAPEKGLNYLVNSSSEVIKNHPEVKFFLVGDGPLKYSLKKLISAKKLDNYFYLIPKSKQFKVAEIMKKASVFVLPSLKEGFPKPLVEAMACGKPVVAFDVDGIKEIFVNKQQGILVEPKNSVSLSKALNSLLANPELRHAMGMQARQRVLERYTWDIVARNIEKIYDEALSEKQ